MTDSEILTRYVTAAQRARGRVLELGLEDLAVTLNPWLFGPDNVMRALQIYLDRGGETITRAEILNLLWIASRDPLLQISCNIQGIPTHEEYMAHARSQA